MDWTWERGVGRLEGFDDGDSIELCKLIEIIWAEKCLSKVYYRFDMVDDYFFVVWSDLKCVNSFQT